MRMDDYDGQMIFGDLVGLKLPDIRLTGEEKLRKNLTQETYPDRESNQRPEILMHPKTYIKKKASYTNCQIPPLTTFAANLKLHTKLSFISHILGPNIS